jgi:hypothetical protein
MTTIFPRITRRVAIALVATLIFGGWTVSADGQARGHVTIRVNAIPERLLADFVAEVQGKSLGPPMAGLSITHILLNRQDYPKQTVDELINGLERLALNSSDERLSVGAAGAFATAGSRRNPRPVPGIAQRMLRMYQQSRHELVRSVLLSSMGQSAEPQVVIQFIRSLAIRDPRAADFPGAASRALATLIVMGEEGRAILQDLHTKGLVRDPNARFELSELAKRNYRFGSQ